MNGKESYFITIIIYLLLCERCTKIPQGKYFVGPRESQKKDKQN